MATTGSQSDTVEAVERAFTIIRLLKRRNGAGVTELSNELGMSKSGVHKHLSTMVEAGYLVNEGGEYRLSFKFVGDGEFVKQNSLLYSVSTTEIDDLATEADAGVYLIVLEHDTAYCVYKAEGENSVATDIDVGDSVQFHSTAAGKAIAAHLPQAHRDTLYEGMLPANTDQTITQTDALREELASVRDDGIAFEDEEHIQGMRSLGKPIHGPDGGVLGAVAVSGPVSLLPDDRFREELVEMVTQTTNFIEVKYSLQSREELEQGSHVPREFY